MRCLISKSRERNLQMSDLNSDLTPSYRNPSSNANRSQITQLILQIALSHMQHVDRLLLCGWCVSCYTQSGAEHVQDDDTGCCAVNQSQLRYKAVNSSQKHRLTRSTSDRSPRCTAERYRPIDHDRSAPTTPDTAGVTHWPASGERTTLPRTGRVAEWTAGDVWRPMTDVDVLVRDFTAQHQQSTTSFQPAEHKVVVSERSTQRKLSTTSPTVGDNSSLDDQYVDWSGTASSPWETCSSTASRQTSLQTVGGASGERLSNYSKLDYCNSMPQPPQSPSTLSRSWFDIERPQLQTTSSSMSSSVVGVGSLRQTASTDLDKCRGGTITETKTICNICSSEAFITDSQAKSDVDDQLSLGVFRERSYRGGAGGSLPRCYGQRSGDLGLPGSASSMPRGMSVFTAGSGKMSAVSGTVTVTSTASFDHSTVLVSTAAAAVVSGSDVRMLTCPSPKRSLSSRDDECEYFFTHASIHARYIAIVRHFGGCDPPSLRDESPPVRSRGEVSLWSLGTPTDCDCRNDQNLKMSTQLTPP